MASIAKATITRQDLEGLPAPSSQAPSITNVKHLSSYNWIEAKEPTIAVPGCPALWSVPRIPRRLKKDSGFIYIAQNAARLPDTPLEPLFRALHVTNPSFDLRAVDIVTDRNNIRKLLSFVNPASNRSGLEPFTISIEIIRDTAIFCREETKTSEYIAPHEFKGFGHEFEKAYTKEQCNGSTGHHRIISYRFGGLSFIVRHETDGCVTAAASRSAIDKKNKSDDISSIMASLSLSNSSPLTTPNGSKMSIRHEGETVPIGSTLEIKTRVSHKPLEIRDVVVQLWVSQTPNLVRAYHRNGLFQEPKVEDVTGAIKKWEGEHSEDLTKLAALLSKIISVAKELGGMTVMKYDSFGDKLTFTRASGKKMLPDDLYSSWAESSVDEEAKSGSTPNTVEERDS